VFKEWHFDGVGDISGERTSFERENETKRIRNSGNEFKKKQKFLKMRKKMRKL
jgi:hypothetical protein